MLASLLWNRQVSSESTTPVYLLIVMRFISY